ncbi:MAG: threonylcarbamoyl-AMP synthase [SAR324 cluster bacterium]|nr:threonylcarbamoyl-AMP synthase [SAR324 cluster bacterium]MBL7035224.1 threonylcarbamoyl-AMP synthase [SAR324 cluster bacterium]
MAIITQLLRFPFSRQDELVVQRALSLNKVLAFPTETCYGLGGNALSKEVQDSVFLLKQRSKKKPLLLLVMPEWLPLLCQWDDSRIDELMKTFWPGPLTLILAANPKLPEHLRNEDGTLAVRYSSSTVAQHLIELGNCPIIGTSANLSGRPSCSTANEVEEQLNNRLELIIDGGKTAGNEVSTIVNCMTEPFNLIRQGVIALTELNQVCEVH